MAIKKTTYNAFTKALIISSLLTANTYADVYTGNDLHSAASTNSDIAALFSANRGTNGGGDQSLQHGDVIQGSEYDDLLVGGLGIDVLFGGAGDDIIIGGTEDFNGFNRDRAFGGAGEDSFLWAPGDGNDFFDGGEGLDVVFFTLIGESTNATGETEGAPFFGVNPPNTVGTQDFDGIHESSPGVPVLNVSGGPGFCELVERDEENAAGLEQLGLDHLVRFVLRGPRAAFDAADPSIDPSTLDTGLRIAVHLKNVEFVVCAGKEAGTVKILDISTVPAQEVDRLSLPATAASLLPSQD